MSSSIEFLSVIKNFNTISKFVFGDQLPIVLRTIGGDDCVDAALFALSTSSSNPRDRITSAINHLEQAHISYSKVHRSVKNYYAYQQREYDIDSALTKDLLVCALMTLCHYALQDYSAAERTLQVGMNITKEDRKYKVMPRFLGIPSADPRSLGMFSPKALSSTFKKISSGFTTPGIGAYEYSEFYEKMKNL